MERKLTETFLRALPTPTTRIEIRDLGCPGLRVRVTEHGTKTFSFLSRDRGAKQPRETIGVWTGEPGGVTLAAAQERARRLSTFVDEARSAPAGPRVQANQCRAGSFRALAETWVQVWVSQKKPSTAAEYKRILARYLMPFFADLDVRRGELTREVIHARIDAVTVGGATGARPGGASYQANRVAAVVSGICKFGVRRGWMSAHPFTAAGRNPEHAGDRVLSKAEILKLWTACSTDPDPVAAGAVWLELLLGQRVGEILGMRHADLDLDAGTWTIRMVVAKNEVPTLVLLVPEVVRLLRGIQKRTGNPTYMFPHKGRRGAQYADDVPGPLTDATTSFRDCMDRIQGVVDFTTHDLRRTLSTNLGRLKVADSVIDAILNHVPVGVTRKHYQLWKYTDEKREALSLWTAEVDGWIREAEAKQSPAAGRRGRVVAFDRA